MRRIVAPVVALALSSLCFTQDGQIPVRAKPTNIKSTSVSKSLAMAESGIPFVLGVGGSFGAYAGSASGMNLPQIMQNYTDLAGLPVAAYGFVSLGGIFAPGDLAERLKGFEQDAAKVPGFSGKSFWTTTGPEADPDRTVFKQWVEKLHGKLDANTVDKASASMYFDYENTRIVLLDTDAPQADGAKGRANLAWLKSILEQTEKRKQTQAIVVMGHLPLAAPQGSAEGTALGNAAEALELLKQHKKCVAYIAGSPGRYERTYLGGTQIHQIIVGNGGGDFDPAWKPSQGPFHGFGILAVLQNGRVIFVPMVRRPELGTVDKPAPSVAAREIILFDPPLKD